MDVAGNVSIFAQHLERQVLLKNNHMEDKEQLKNVDYNERYIPSCNYVNTQDMAVNPYLELISFAYNRYFPKFTTSKSIRDYIEIARGCYAGKFAAEIGGMFPEGFALAFDDAGESHDEGDIPALVLRKGGETVGMLTCESISGSGTEPRTVTILSFTDIDMFGFLDIEKESNTFNFSKSDTEPKTIDMALAMMLCVATEFMAGGSDFLKFFKRKTLVAKNITAMFNKFVKPYVGDGMAVFRMQTFILTALCDNKFYTKEVPYEGYLDSIKYFADAMKGIYGDRFVKHDGADAASAQAEA